MATITVLGAGLAGLATAMLLDRDGHAVTVLERDPAPPPVPGDTAWDGWVRAGVSQFRQAHFMLPRWWTETRAVLPEVGPALLAAGAARLNTLEILPPAYRGARREGDDRFDTITARRPVLEAAMAAAVGVPVHRGVRVTGLTFAARSDVPRVTGVVADDGREWPADLVVDCGGRHSAVPSWLPRPPGVERADRGFVYYGRHFRGRRPAVRTFLQHNYDSLSVMTLPADNGTWAVVITTSAADHALRCLRDPARWQAALALYPLAAGWTAGEPISGIDVMGGLEDRLHHWVVDGRPVATGVVPVGDAWAATNPSLARGAALAARQARVLRDVLREVDAGEADKLATRFHEATAEEVEPLYRLTRWYDDHRLAEIGADVAGVAYATDDVRWHAAKALSAAALRDPALARSYLSVSGFLATPAEVFAEPGVRDRALRLGGSAPHYPMPGPVRSELLAAVA